MAETKMNSNERIVLSAIIARTNLGKDPPKASEVHKLLGMKGLTIENAVSTVFNELIKSDEHFETFVEEAKAFLGEVLKKPHAVLEKEYPEEISLVFSPPPKEEPPKPVIETPPPPKIEPVKEAQPSNAKEKPKMEEKADPKDVDELRSQLGMRPKHSKKHAYPPGKSREENLQYIMKGVRVHADQNLDKGENWAIISHLNENELRFLVGVGRTVNSSIYIVREKLKTMTLDNIKEATAKDLFGKVQPKKTEPNPQSDFLK